MMSNRILETERLSLREFNLNDAKFTLQLLNTPTWLKFIGDKNVHNIKEAENYLTAGPMTSYKEHGFGLWLVSQKERNKPIGMCGLIKRDYLAEVDIGFALLPNYAGLGYGYEIASATLTHSRNILQIDKVMAITDVNNASSIKLLNKLGLRFEKSIITPDHDTVSLFK